MITDKDIAQALKSQKAKPSKEWQNATLKRLRELSSENHVTETVGMRNSLRDAVASLASYFFPTSTMNPVFLKTIGSLAAVCVITVGTHAVANGSTPENSFLYAIDRGFEKAELAFASIGGNISVAHKHLIHADERAMEIEVLLKGEASASVSFRDLFIETAHAQGVRANAQVSAHIELLLNDCQYSLDKAYALLEEAADNASAKAQAKLAASVETTSQSISQRLGASAQATAEADVRPAVRKAVEKVRETEKKARSFKVKVEAEVKIETDNRKEEPEEKTGEDAAIEGNTTIKSDTKVDTRSGVEVETDTSVDANVEVDVPVVEIDSEGSVNINLGTNNKRQGGGSATTKTEAESNSDAESETTTTTNNKSEQKTSGSTESEVNGEVKVDIEGSVESNADGVKANTNIESETEVNVGL